jgi:hypothetical protein
MGHSLSWIAINGKPTEEVQQILGVKVTGKRGNFGEHALVGRQLQNGWYILIANSCDDRITKGKTLTELSRGCQVVTCSIEEHVMFSSCTNWKKGKKIWSIRHNGDQGTFNIVSSGKLPDSYSSLKDEIFKKQKVDGGENADVDYVFELPLEIAKRVVGFKHDEEFSEGDDSYEIYNLNFLQRVSRRVFASTWLYIIGILLFFIVLGVAGGVLGVWIKRVVTSIVL